MKNKIRDIIAINPLVSIRRLQEIVEDDTGRSISDKYLTKLIHKIRQGVIVTSDRKKLNVRLSEVRERYRVLIEHLLRTVYWKYEFREIYGLEMPNYKERLQAIKLIAKMETDLFRAELMAGMFEDRRAAIGEMLQQGVLPTELHEQVVGIFRSYKFQTSPTVMNP